MIQKKYWICTDQQRNFPEKSELMFMHEIIAKNRLGYQIVILDRIALAKQGDNALGSIHLSMCLRVCSLPV